MTCCDGPCFCALAASDPAALVTLTGYAPISDLTLVAEALGKAPAEHAIPALVKLLAHADRAVVEGAIMGSAHHACDASIRAALEAVAARFGGDWLGDFAAGVLAEDGL